MNADRDLFQELLDSVTDGKPVRDDAGQSASEPMRARITAVHQLARISEFNRRLQHVPATPSPERWGGLVVLEPIGVGSRGQVFRAWDPTLQREVALKLLRPGSDEGSLMDEGRAAARIRHPNVVTVLGIDRHDGQIGMWMELARGTSLEQEVRDRGALAARDAIQLGLQIASALATVHAQGVLHRDIKPANVIRDSESRFVLADFGLGRRWNLEAIESAAPSGTPMYMAPELLAGGPATERTDVYALGMLLWFALAGRHPFEVGSLAVLAKLARLGPGPRLRDMRPDLPETLVALVERAIAPEPQARLARARDLEEALKSVSIPVASTTRWRAPIFAAAAILILVVAAAWFALRPSARSTPDAASPPAVASIPAASFDIEASFLRRDDRGSIRLITGDRVRPGDHLSLEARATRPIWLYVLNEDERGEHFLLFPQPIFEVRNPLPANSAVVLPGPIAGRENAWTVTSAGGREHFLVVAALEPVAELESELAHLPAAEPGRPVRYATVSPPTIRVLRGVGGVEEPPAAPPPSEDAHAFDRFRSLAGRESGVRGVWVRQVVLENPAP